MYAQLAMAAVLGDSILNLGFRDCQTNITPETSQTHWAISYHPASAFAPAGSESVALGAQREVSPGLVHTSFAPASKKAFTSSDKALHGGRERRKQHVSLKIVSGCICLVLVVVPLLLLLLLLC
jgi:hypothetical protein